MTTRMPLTRPDRHTRVGKRICPSCNGILFRTWRRPIDRISSLILPVRRYRCRSFSCQWEGNLRNDGAASATLGAGTGPPVKAHSPRVPKSVAIQMWLAAVGVAALVSLPITDWLSTSALANAESQQKQGLPSISLAGQGTRLELPVKLPLVEPSDGAIDRK